MLWMKFQQKSIDAFAMNEYLIPVITLNIMENCGPLVGAYNALFLMYNMLEAFNYYALPEGTQMNILVYSNILSKI